MPQGEFIRHAVDIAREAGGTINDADIRVSDGSGGSSDGDTGRQGSVGAWRNSFLNAPYMKNHQAGLGFVTETMETAVTWDRWPNLDQTVRAALQDALDRVCGGGTVSCRFTHVYTDGPAPYFTFEGMGRLGAELEMYAEIKQAASDAIMAAGGTITHHHAVGRLHRPGTTSNARVVRPGVKGRQADARPQRGIESGTSDRRLDRYGFSKNNWPRWRIRNTITLNLRAPR